MLISNEIIFQYLVVFSFNLFYQGPKICRHQNFTEFLTKQFWCSFLYNQMFYKERYGLSSKHILHVSWRFHPTFQLDKNFQCIFELIYILLRQSIKLASNHSRLVI